MESGSPQQRIRHGYYPCDDQEQRQKTRVGAGAEVHADAREKYEGQPDEHHKAKKFQVLPASVWVKVEAAAVEVDRGLEVLPVAEAAGGVPIHWIFEFRPSAV